MQTRSLRNIKAAVAASAMLILLGSSVAYAQNAASQTTFHSGFEFQVVDPNEPIVSTDVTGTFINHDIVIHVNMSAHDGVKQLKGSYSIFLQIWNDTTSSYQLYSTLVSGKTITLTPTPTTLAFTFNTKVAGTYNVDVVFNTTSVDLA